MIKYRKNPFSSEELTDIPFVAGETGAALITRVLLADGQTEVTEEMLRHYHLVVDGVVVSPDLVPFVKIEEGKSYLVAPKIQGGEGGQLFKQLAVVLVTVAASYFLGPAGLGLQGAGLAAATAGASIVASLALNALIPPLPLPSLGGLGATSSFEGSQMYTIASQQNAAKKFGRVAKVYGTHRVFPAVAANPYTEIEASPENGKLVQTFYCIYDFGLGPMSVTDLRIGDTPLAAFQDLEYRLVDLNRPLANQGPWDAQVGSAFSLYKGDVVKDQIGVVLSKNQNDLGVAENEFRIVRNASADNQGDAQEITLDFVFAEGLTSFGTDGTNGTATVALKVEFSAVGSGKWLAYDNLNFVNSFKGVGTADLTTSRTTLDILPIRDKFSRPNQGVGYVLLSSSSSQIPSTGQPNIFGNVYPAATIFTEVWGYPEGTRFITARPGGASIGDSISCRGTVIGTVLSITPSPFTGYVRYNFITGSKVAGPVFTYLRYKPDDVFPRRSDFQGLGYNVDRFTTLNRVFREASTGVGAVYVSANSTTPVYATVKFTPKQVGQYRVRITRADSFAQKTFQVRDACTVLSLQTRFARQPVVTDKRHLFLEIKIRATNQINGAIQNLSGVCSSVLEAYDTGSNSWVLRQTNNPAWVFADLLCGENNKKAISRDRLHLPSLLEWADFCDAIPASPPGQTFVAPRFGANFVLDFDTTLQSMINTLTNSYQASMNVIDGKYGVLIDKGQLAPVQVFSPRNSWDFQSTRSYGDMPDALKIQFINPDKAWQTDEVVVYDNGKDANNALLIEDLTTFGCTNFEQAWRYGRYMLAQAKLRQERISINVDFEHLVCTRGDLVYYAQDVMKAGGRPARVKTVSGNRITIDDGLETSGLLSYGYVARSTSGIFTSTLTVINSDTFDLDGFIPAVGDIVIIGEVGNVVIECLVKSITPNNDLSALIELVEYAPAVYDAESTNILPDYLPQLNQNLSGTDFAPGPVENLAVIRNGYSVLGADYQYFIDLDWDVPTGSAFEEFEIYVDSGAGYNLFDFTQESEFRYIVDQDDLGIPHNFKVIAVSANGNKLSLVEVPFVTATPIRKITPPSDVAALYIDITNQVISLSWPQVLDADLKEYLIRYSTITDSSATWEASIPLLRADRFTTLASAQGRVGTYFIKAVDFNNNESLNPARAITSVPGLFDLNVITETDDFPDLNGVRDTVETDTGGLVLRRLSISGPDSNQYFPEGFYYYENLLNLGEIFTVRLQSRIQAEGFTVGDLMVNWDPLSDLTALTLAGTSDWDVETQVRGTDQFNVMAEWASLDLIDPISEGNQDLFTPWTKFTVGDFTARIFQFRLRLISNKPSVTPRVFSGVVRSDMPDRLESFSNLIAPDTGLTVTYTPPFYGPGTTPAIQITQDNAQQGDYYVITGKTLDSFTINFYDLNGMPVSRQFDAFVKGYGRRAFAVI